VIASVAVPVSLIGAFGVMYLLGYSLDNLSLMALTISTGFVVDDVIVVLENVTRHIEAGTPRIRAALQGAREVAFTVLSMSLSLVAVFVPILLMGGIGGRLFREFAVTFSVTIAISSVISLTTTPMMCAYLLPQRREHGHSRLYRAGERVCDDARPLRPLTTAGIAMAGLGHTRPVGDAVPLRSFPSGGPARCRPGSTRRQLPSAH
jgi:multidrug efflux pump